ncbi:RNA polymerase sigma factor SigJ [Actinacidiphila sp. bgisy144]|uniref:RNA polymerase sigma factor SigJ n=1 Tax=unclassified Actinacidiphila TaxID=2995708 RepID=UPI003EBBE529
MSTEPGQGGGDAALDEAMRERRRLIGVAYRLLGSLADAEDVVQETYARWYALPPRQQDAIENVGAWLTKVAGRICLDQLRSARARRERYVGEWIPEPVPGSAELISGWSGGAEVDPADRVTLDESLSMAFLVLLEAMTPAERVAFILHDVFRYPFPEVAEIVGRTPAACRQLATSARRRVRAERGAQPPTDRHTRIVREFKQAWEDLDVNAMIGLLDPDATAVGDGGGIVSALPHPLHGSTPIARYFVAIARRGGAGVQILEETVNGRPGLVLRQDGAALAVLAFDIAEDRVTHVWAVRNPHKLGPWMDD